MRSKTALYNTIRTGITAASALPEDSPLKNVYLYDTPRGSVAVENYSKVIRIDISSGSLIRTNDETRREQAVNFTVQCFVLPAGETLEQEDAAVDASFDLAEAVFDYLNANPTLENGVTDLDLPEGEDNFVNGMANLGATRYGATYLFGIINPY